MTYFLVPNMVPIFFTKAEITYNTPKYCT